jgi:hypothetical protein
LRSESRGAASALLLAGLATLAACPESRSLASPAPPSPAAGREARASDLLFRAGHELWVGGDLAAARRDLEELAGNPSASGEDRALAELRLAEIEELADEKRAALSHLERARALGGPGSAVALDAEDRRSRILAAAPLSDLRGPLPGTVVLRGESAGIVQAFRRAEKLLERLHRLVVAPRLEEMDAVLRVKRRGLAAALAAYAELDRDGGLAARAAARFRTAELHHHFAEALAFESPPELRPDLAQSLARQRLSESRGHLRKALVAYRTLRELPTAPGTAPWQRLAEKEAATLSLVLEPAPARRP